MSGKIFPGPRIFELKKKTHLIDAVAPKPPVFEFCPSGAVVRETEGSALLEQWSERQKALPSWGSGQRDGRFCPSCSSTQR